MKLFRTLSCKGLTEIKMEMQSQAQAHACIRFPPIIVIFNENVTQRIASCPMSEPQHTSILIKDFPNTKWGISKNKKRDKMWQSQNPFLRHSVLF